MLSKQEVKHIASLARIHLDEKEVDHFTQNLGGILDYVAKLEKLNVENVEPTTHALPLKNIYREDVIQPSLSQQDALKIAVSQHHGSFKVPKVIE